MKQVKQTLVERAEERETAEQSGWRASLAAWAVNIGVMVSAVLTIIYLMLLVAEATSLPSPAAISPSWLIESAKVAAAEQSGTYLPSPWGYIFGVLVGIVAIVPAEISLMVWRERLASDRAITSGQRYVAVTAMVFSGIFSALTTSSFFSYFLPQLFPDSFMAIAPTLNVGAIVGSWIVFILAIVAYGIFSRQTQQNLSQAAAMQSVFNARMSVLTGAAEAIRTEADTLIATMDKEGVFATDARELIVAALGMGEERISAPALPSLVSSSPQMTVERPIGFETVTQRPNVTDTTQEITPEQWASYQAFMAQQSAGDDFLSQSEEA